MVRDSTQEPPCRHFCNLSLMKTSILDGTTQDCGANFLTMAMVATTIYLTFIWNSTGKGQLPISIFLPPWSGFNGAFLHAWCIPHHNSIRQVWASVCVCACVNAHVHVNIQQTCTGIYIYVWEGTWELQTHLFMIIYVSLQLCRYAGR